MLQYSADTMYCTVNSDSARNAIHVYVYTEILDLERNVFFSRKGRKVWKIDIPEQREDDILRVR